MNQATSVPMTRTSLSTPDYIRAVSRAYELAPLFSPEAALAWSDLAAETSDHFYGISRGLDIVVVNRANPYGSAYEMLADIANGRIMVSDANSNHPVWDRDENIRFRVVHDVLGHGSTGAGFDFRGELRAYEKHLEHTESPRAKLALFTEAVGQVAYAIDHGSFGVQKAAILPSWLQWAYKESH